MGGLLTEMRAKATKKGSMMGFAVLEDLTGQIECLIFPKIYELYHHDLQEDAAVLLTGHLSVREDEDTKLLVDAVEPLNQASAPKSPPEEKLSDVELARRSPVKLYLRMERGQMEDVSRVLRTFAGPIPVYMNLPAEGVTLLAPRDCWCQEGAVNALWDCLSPDDIRLVDKREGRGRA